MDNCDCKFLMGRGEGVENWNVLGGGFMDIQGEPSSCMIHVFTYKLVATCYYTGTG